MFIWRLASNVLPTKNRMRDLISDYDDLCPLCGKESESSLHLFLYWSYLELYGLVVTGVLKSMNWILITNLSWWSSLLIPPKIWGLTKIKGIVLHYLESCCWNLFGK